MKLLFLALLSLSSAAADAARDNLWREVTNPRLDDGAAGLAPSLLAPRVYIGAELAEVGYSGLQPSFPGLWQINVKAPAAAPAGQVPIFAAIGGLANNGVTLTIAK